MGHLDFRRLPNTPGWAKVVEHIHSGSDAASVADATLKASDKLLDHAANDQTLHFCVWLLTEIPQAARRHDFGKALRDLGLDVPDHPGVVDIATAFTATVDGRFPKAHERSDFSELAQLAAAETIASLSRDRMHSLFEATPEDVRQAFRSFASGSQYAVLARSYFARLTARYLAYVLSRELSNHVGPASRFADSDEHTQFMRSLDRYAREKASVVERFAAGWYSKAQFQGGTNKQKAANFARYALTKIRRQVVETPTNA